jgi:hypothetical protein
MGSEETHKGQPESRSETATEEDIKFINQYSIGEFNYEIDEKLTKEDARIIWQILLRLKNSGYIEDVGKLNHPNGFLWKFKRLK